ncbi:MAG: omptin family outer membrane protease [Desulfofustis sp.]|nr:omptin family outer membrane protease [Desulfofustis sp.]
MKHWKISCFSLVLGVALVPGSIAAPIGNAASLSTASGGPTFSLSAGAELMAGETLYQIGYPAVDTRGVRYDGYFPFSELEWPLDVWLVRVEGAAVVNDRWRGKISVKKNMSTPNDEMVDSDWLTPANPAILDVYSEFSISDFEALIVDADVEWLFFRQQALSLFVGAGIVYQNFDYESELIYQFSPSGLEGFTYAGDGRTGITYEMTYSLPYVKVGADLELAPGLTILGSFAYSPIVQAEDTDHHLLREFGGKTASGDMDGTAFLVDVIGRYVVTPAFFVEAGFHYLHIEVDGSQYQEYGIGIPIGTFHQEAESNQTSGYLSVGYRF